jgi:hypothetical protein
VPRTAARFVVFFFIVFPTGEERARVVLLSNATSPSAERQTCLRERIDSMYIVKSSETLKRELRVTGKNFALVPRGRRRDAKFVMPIRVMN